MQLYPAVDIRDGHAVRLVQGDYDRETAYDADPVAAARRWREDGAEILHVVDLDGAREGSPRNLEEIARIADAVDCPIQVGGGLRDAESVGLALKSGAARVVVGTAALRDPAFLAEMLERHGEAVVVAVDSRGGKVSVAGWTETSEVDAAEAVADLGGRGVARLLFTPIEVDGTLAGPDIQELGRMAMATEADVIYSGGIGSLDHLRALAESAPPNVTGAIVGRALYDRRFTVAEAAAALRG